MRGHAAKAREEARRLQAAAEARAKAEAEAAAKAKAAASEYPCMPPCTHVRISPTSLGKVHSSSAWVIGGGCWYAVVGVAMLGRRLRMVD